MTFAKALQGYSFAILYIIATCSSLFFVETFSAKLNINPMVMLFSNAVFATFVMHVVLLQKLKNIYAKFLQSKINTLLMLISVMMIVISSFYSVTKIGTMAYLVLYFTEIGLFSNIYESIYYKKLPLYLCSLIFLYVCYYLVKILYFVDTASVILTTAGSFSGVLYSKCSQQFGKQLKMSAIEILSIRYWLVILTLSFVLFNNINETISGFKIIEHQLLLIAFISVSTLILPLYMAQKSLQYIPFTHNGLINSCTPLLIISASILFLHQKVNIVFIYASLFVFVNAIFVISMQAFKQKYII